MTDSEILNHPILAGFKCPAEYKDAQVPLHKGNPLIEALPPIYEPDEVFTLLTEFPEYDDRQRSWGKQTRMHCVQQIKHFMQPLPYHVRLESAFSRIIRDGYTVRNPLSPIYTRQFSIGFQKILEAGLNGEGKNITGNRPSASGFAIIGISGVGKTTAVERTLLLYPQVIQHVRYQQHSFILKQLVWLKLECPASGSLKVLCQNFFRQVDLILGTNYYKTHMNSRSTKESLLVPMAQIASLHGIGVLVIDEIQRLKKVKNSGREEMLEYFTELINTIGVPVVLVGTYKCMFLFESTFAEARRASGQGDHILSQMKDEADWNFFLESLWELQWTKKVCPLTDELRKVMYEEAQGIPDIAVKLYMNTQWEVISSETDEQAIEITPKIIRNVALKSLKLLRPMLQALKNGDQKALEEFEDLKPDWLTLNEYIKKMEEKIEIEGRIAREHLRAVRQKEKNNHLVELVILATNLGLNRDEAEKVAVTVLETSNNTAELTNMRQQVAALILDSKGLTKGESVESFDRVINMENAKKRRKVKLEMEDSNPWKIVYEALSRNVPVREALEKSNLLKPPMKEFGL
ncbi:ATP-binding protein [Brevibacillus porteri]|uniref:ATP-binding protein n=1 Tax=Brevibacillus porteri TaxID=2126350 RepID=UPI00362DA2C3